MVDFGLKLEDNKVAEWSNDYMNYEKLKALLKKAKQAAEKLATAEKKTPDLAARVRSSLNLKGNRDESISRTSSRSGLSRSLSEVSLSGLDDEEVSKAVKASRDNVESSTLFGVHTLVEDLSAAEEDFGFFDTTDSPGKKLSPAQREDMIPLNDAQKNYGSLTGGGLSLNNRVDSSKFSLDSSFHSQMSKPLKPSGGSSNSLSNLAQAVGGYFQKDAFSRMEACMTEVDDSILVFSSYLYREVRELHIVSSIASFKS